MTSKGSQTQKRSFSSIMNCKLYWRLFRRVLARGLNSPRAEYIKYVWVCAAVAGDIEIRLWPPTNHVAVVGLLLAATGFFFRFKVYYISVGKSWRSNGWKVSELLKIFFAFSLLLRKEKEDGDSGTFPAQKKQQKPKVGRSEAAEATWLLLLLFPVEQRQLLYQQQQNKSREKKSISLWSPESLGIKNGFKPSFFEGSKNRIEAAEVNFG